MPFYITRFLVKIFMFAFFRIKLINAENFPLEGPVLVCFNHTSNWDVPLVATIFPRTLCFMAKKELFDIFIISSIIKSSGAFPVTRGAGDVGAIKAAMNVLKENKALAMFPEGRRVKKGQPHKAKPGVVMIAARTKVPVLPIAISGKYRLFGKLTVTVGEPMYFGSDDGKKLTMEQMQKMSDDLLRHILTMAGEEFED